MKVTNWRRKLIASILAGGALAPSVSRAVSIPLGDPSFEAYTVPTYVPPNGGYAYSDLYRPTSAWVDDLDSPISASGVQRLQDDGASNWIYNTAYGEDGPPFRGRPRTGNQAMHGIGHYNAQKVSTFEAEKFYTFSVWAQGDNDAVAADDKVYLYLFNGSIPFNETGAGTLKFKAFQGGPGGDFANRGNSMTATQSQANWQQISITHVTFPGAPEIGQPIGVGFYLQRDAAIDDATLDVDDAANHLMILEVNTTDGQVRIRNQTGAAIRIDYYDIKSATGALNADAWNSLEEQNLAGFPAGNGFGSGWEEAGGSSSTALGESYLTGNSSVGNDPVGLGAAFNVGGAHDLYFEYGAILSSAQPPDGDYNNNGVVDAADYIVWRKTNGTQPAYNTWRSHFGETSSFPPSTLLRGLVHYVPSFSGSGLLTGSSVPEPTSIFLVGVGFAVMLAGGRNRKTNSAIS